MEQLVFTPEQITTMCEAVSGVNGLCSPDDCGPTEQGTHCEVLAYCYYSQLAFKTINAALVNAKRRKDLEDVREDVHSMMDIWERWQEDVHEETDTDGLYDRIVRALRMLYELATELASTK